MHLLYLTCLTEQDLFDRTSTKHQFNYNIKEDNMQMYARLKKGVFVHIIHVESAKATAI